MPPAQTSATFLAVLPVPAAMSRSQSPEPRASATAASSTRTRPAQRRRETFASEAEDLAQTLVTGMFHPEALEEALEEATEADL